jgi:hypothetical protein
MRFGIFIRSVGERTEALCREACLREVPPEDVHVIKDVYPAARAYLEMFNRAQEENYDWFGGVDADIVLKKWWMRMVRDKIREVERREFFVFSFHVRDKFLGVIDRGNHFYNGRYVNEAREVLLKKTWNSSKPESLIESHVVAESAPYPGVIGYHGYDQYRRDIAYRFWLQYKRKPLREIERALRDGGKDKDWEAARLGWEKSKKEVVNNLLIRSGIKTARPDQRNKNRIDVWLRKNGIDEDDTSEITLDYFYESKRREEE